MIHLYLPIKSGDFPSDNDWLETTVFVHCFFSPVPPGGDRSSKAQSLRAAQFYLARSSILEEGGSKKHKETCMRYNTYILPMVHVFVPPSSHIYVWISIAKKSVLSTLEMALTFFFVWKHQHHPVRWELGVSNFKLLKFPVDINPPHNPWVWRKIWVMTSLDLHFFSFLGTWTTWTTWSIPFWSWDTKMDHP